jgi:hypothetical protein
MRNFLSVLPVPGVHRGAPLSMRSDRRSKFIRYVRVINELMFQDGVFHPNAKAEITNGGWN